VPPQYQHRVLFWGVLGALFFRIIFIFAGVALIQKFSWMIYVFGGFLVITGIRMLKDEAGPPV
jgi:tellurite resistance protein TerC